MSEPTAQPPPRDEVEAAGEAACALHRVCEACGALEDGPAPPVCGRCGARRNGERLVQDVAAGPDHQPRT